MLEFHCIDNRKTAKILYMNTLRTYSSAAWDPMQDYYGITPEFFPVLHLNSAEISRT